MAPVATFAPSKSRKAEKDEEGHAAVTPLIRDQDLKTSMSSPPLPFFTTDEEVGMLQKKRLWMWFSATSARIRTCYKVRSG